MRLFRGWGWPNAYYCTTNQCGDSIVVFLMGWLGVLYGGAALTWLANPLLIIGWILTYRNSKYALAVSLFATLICLSFLLFDQIISNEAGHYHPIISYQSGYWLWLSSAAIMFLCHVSLFLLKKKQQKNIKWDNTPS